VHNWPKGWPHRRARPDSEHYLVKLGLSIDVIIPTFQGWELTQRCLARLREQTVTHVVILVDNASTDGTPAKVRALFPEVRLVELDRNVGFPMACNQGAAAGNGDVLVLLNNDVEPRPDFLERLAQPLEKDPRVGSAAALLVFPGEHTIDSIGLTADSTLAGFPRLRGRPVSDAASTRPVLVGPSGGGGAYRRAAWEQLGGLDGGVLAYGEDLDIALRLRSSGWQTAAASEALGVHLGSASFGRRSSWQRYQGGFARGYFLRRYGVLGTSAAARTVATEVIVAVVDAVLARDLSALRGRVAGWRSAKGLEQRPRPPSSAIDHTISFRESLRLRRAVYATL
jgi:N-acetylglucosaminyl-diphospho-decaprenol L-rhamnosyltransferase